MCYVRTHLVEEIAHPVLRVIKREVKDARRDIAVINAGLHYGIGDPAYDAGFAFLKKFITEHREELPLILWKDTSPQHFEYDKGYFWWVCLPCTAVRACVLCWHVKSERTNWHRAHRQWCMSVQPPKYSCPSNTQKGCRFTCVLLHQVGGQQQGQDGGEAAREVPALHG